MQIEKNRWERLIALKVSLGGIVFIWCKVRDLRMGAEHEEKDLIRRIFSLRSSAGFVEYRHDHLIQNPHPSFHVE